jgi:hypothetical protein
MTRLKTTSYSDLTQQNWEGKLYFTFLRSNADFLVKIKISKHFVMRTKSKKKDAQLPWLATCKSNSSFQSS